MSFGTDTPIIRNFNTLPQSSLEFVKSNLGLRMTMPELLYAARHYKSRSGSDTDPQTLYFLDALAYPAQIALDKVAISELLTNEPYVAETYRDFIDKSRVLGKDPDKPYTLEDVARMPTRYLRSLAQSSKQALRIGMRRDNVAYAATGHASEYSLACEKGRFDVLEPLPLKLKTHAEYGDALVLLTPGGDMKRAQYDTALAAFLKDREVSACVRCIEDCSGTSIAHAALAMGSGMVLNVGRLPAELQALPALAQATCGNLIALPRDMAEVLERKAAEYALNAVFFGVVDHAGYLIVRNGKDMLLCLDVPYLKSVCFIRTYSLRIEDEAHLYVTQDAELPYPRAVPLVTTGHQPLLQIANDTQTVLRSQDLMRTSCAMTVAAGQNPYHSALLCAMNAYCTAVSAGCKPQSISMHAHLHVKRVLPDAQAMGQALAALLGLYRFSMESVTEIDTETDIADHQTELTVLASAPTDMVIPSKAEGGSKIYLLHPLYSEYGMPVWQDFSKMITYLHQQMRAGKIKSARALCDKTVKQALHDMCDGVCDTVINSKYEQTLSLRYPGAVLVESDAGLEGDLIAVCAPRASAKGFSDDCSEIWYQLPSASVVVCGDTHGGHRICDVLEMAGAQPELYEFCDDPDLCNPLSAKLRASQILVFAGSYQEAHTALCHPRIARAVRDVVANDGCVIAIGQTALAFAEHGLLPQVSTCSLHDASFADVTPCVQDFRLTDVQGRLYCEQDTLTVCPEQGGMLRICVNDTLCSDGFLDQSGRILGLYLGCTDKILENTVKYYV